MAKEQEEAISRLRKITNRQILYGNKLGITIEGFKELQEDLETVLNMLKEKDAEIEQKNEVLNRVYDFIWENDCCRYFSKKHALYNQVLNFDSCLGNCKRNCIKQYFERKVEDECKR